MQYFPEGDLESHLNDEASLPEDEARIITRQVLEGLQVMHAKKFTHRDIKPKVCRPTAIE
jgi:calcium/calmodulin-dependent protein kinase I